ncbi:hypothetical protein ACWEG1_05810 [Streptomyces bauhiniae]
MTALDDLYAEAIPHRPEPAPPAVRPYTQQWTRAEQDAHWRELCIAVGTPKAERPAVHARRTAEAEETAA